jgi:hypothetical protein
VTYQEAAKVDSCHHRPGIANCAIVVGKYLWLLLLLPLLLLLLMKLFPGSMSGSILIRRVRVAVVGYYYRCSHGCAHHCSQDHDAFRTEVCWFEAVAMATVVEASWHCCRYRHFVTNVVIAIVAH